MNRDITRRDLLLAAGTAALIGSNAAKAAMIAPRDISELLEELRQQYKLPALAGGACNFDGLQMVGAAGYRKEGGTRKVTVNDKFHLGSCTKAMTGYLLAQLIDEGKLSFDTPLAEALPGNASEMLEDYRKVSLRQVLGHAAGFPGNTAPAGTTLFKLHLLKGTPQEQRAEYVRLALKTPPEAPAGTKHIYSNMGYTVLGAVIEEWRKASWESVASERLFKPLTMETTGFGPMGTKGLEDQPLQHEQRGQKFIPVEPGPFADNPIAVTPAGRVHCSVPDWSRFLHIILKGAAGKDRSLKPDVWKQLLSPLSVSEYGGGWIIVERKWAGGTAFTHAGSNTLNYCNSWVVPAKGFAVFVATNASGEGFEAVMDKTAMALRTEVLKSM